MRFLFLPVVTGRFVVASALLALVVPFAPFSVWKTFLVANIVLALIWLVDCVLAVHPNKVGFERKLMPIVPLNTEVTIDWAVTNPRKKKLNVKIADDLPPSFRYQTLRFAATISGNGRMMSSTTFCPSRRGKFKISEVTIRTYGPLGLGGRQKRRFVDDELRVYPSFLSRREAELRIDKARILEIGLRSVKGHGGGTEFEQLREYNMDDDFRRIDWVATGRSNKPIVRTYRTERNQNVFCLLDCGRLMAAQVDNVPRIEHAMDAIMALTTVASRLGDRVGLTAFDQQVRSEVGISSGPEQITRVTEALYQLQPQLVESDYKRAFIQALMRSRRRSLVVIFSELSEQAVEETLLPALPLIARNHLVFVASVADPEVTKWANAIPEEGNKAFRKAAAMAALAERKRTIAKLRACGVSVVDSTPGKLAAQVADAYLDVKATSRL